MYNMKDESPFARYARLMAEGNAMPGVRPGPSAGYGFAAQPGAYPQGAPTGGLLALMKQRDMPQASYLDDLLGKLIATPDRPYGAGPTTQPVAAPGVPPSTRTTHYYATQPEIYPAPEDFPNISDIWGKAWESRSPRSEPYYTTRSELYPTPEDVSDILDTRELRLQQHEAERQQGEGRTNKPVSETTISRNANTTGEAYANKTPPRYYVIGKRPLDTESGRDFYDRTLSFPWPSLQHRQFISDQGSNWGFFPDGERADGPEFMHQYRYYDEHKYDAELIDEAMRQITAEREAARQTWASTSHGIGDEAMPWYGRNPNKDYMFLTENCQKYIDKVLERAEELATIYNKNLIVP